ncbi:hypothetical protein FH039_11570 [Thermococcus indicus]|uniref:Uncharacterized protein n=1 Tax=Thermococcus indicus TaxID=2586643 RepID=A0A4Y5SMG2_9EURY|nr:hypothetical protein [Thermococcus indicus]QDA32107.1 hypothetical protein FH039_11570 [Thermococcus indicus]
MSKSKALALIVITLLMTVGLASAVLPPRGAIERILTDKGVLIGRVDAAEVESGVSYMHLYGSGNYSESGMAPYHVSVHIKRYEVGSPEDFSRLDEYAKPMNLTQDFKITPLKTNITYYPDGSDGAPVTRELLVGYEFTYSFTETYTVFTVTLTAYGGYSKSPNDFIETSCVYDINGSSTCYDYFKEDEYRKYREQILAVMNSDFRGFFSGMANDVFNAVISQNYPLRVGDITISAISNYGSNESSSGEASVSPGYIGEIYFTPEDANGTTLMALTFNLFDANGIYSLTVSYSGPGGPYSGKPRVLTEEEYFAKLTSERTSTEAYLCEGWMRNGMASVVLEILIPPGELREGPARAVVRTDSGEEVEVSWMFVKSENAGEANATTQQPEKATVRITSPRNGARLEPTVGDAFVIPLWAEVKGNASYAVVISPDGSRHRVDAGGGFIADILRITNPGNSGEISVQLYDAEGNVIASDSVSLNFWGEEKPGDGIDNDGDGLIDCDDPDVFTCDECVLEKQKEWAEGIYKRHVEYLKKAIELNPSMESVYSIYLDDINEIHGKYGDNPEEMVRRMNAYMNEKVYGRQKLNAYLSIFKDDPEKQAELLDIAKKYQYDPIMRDIKLKDFVYSHAEEESTKEALKNAILTGIIDPPKWLVGGQYGSGGALDWAQFVATNFEKVGDTVKLKGNAKVKMLTTPLGIFLVAQDAKSLMDQARELSKMNLDDRTKVSIIVLDGATKIGKLLDPTGYFGNMADATVSSLVNLRKKLEERNGGWFTWNGYVLHETETPGIYEDYETGKKFRRVSGGWLGPTTFVEVK